MKKIIVNSLFLITLVFLCAGWGPLTHKKILSKSSLSFNDEMYGFKAWIPFLEKYASLPDLIRETLPEESKNHFIDLDAYAEFLEKGSINPDYNDLIVTYGKKFVDEQGLLPWATLHAYDSLVLAIKSADWGNAQIWAAKLAHYVADGHMPLHLTTNYDGQQTNNKGIHRRYEENMMNRFMDKVNYDGLDVKEIKNTQSYIFGYLYSNYRYVQGIMEGDTYGKKMEGASDGDMYYREMWNKTSEFTVPLLERASNAYACLLYTAWKNAGSPVVGFLGEDKIFAGKDVVLKAIYWDKDEMSFKINFVVRKRSFVLLEIRNEKGEKVKTLLKDTLWVGDNTITWTPDNSVLYGNYQVILNSPDNVQIKVFPFCAN